jgi:hypothetical protein
VNFKEHYLNQTGINFEFDAQPETVDVETLSGDTPVTRPRS